MTTFCHHPVRFVQRSGRIGLILALISFPLLFPSLAHAQQGAASLTGFVSDSATKEKMISATVALRGTTLGAITNKQGFFTIKEIPPGTYTVTASFVGYRRVEQELTFAPGESKRVEFELPPNPVTTKEITVTADDEIERREILVSRVDIPVEQLSQLRIGGEADIFRSLQYLPGVLTSSQLSSGLYIRGGSPDQNLVLIDGSTVYNPSHLLGFFSTFNPDAVKNVELIKGGYPAEYGGRLSAVLDLTQKDGNREKVEGVASVGAISSRLSLQGPLGAGSWFIGGRRTYLDLILGLLPQDPAEPFPDFAFYDANAKLTQNLGDNDIISASGFLSRDDLGLNGGGIDFNVHIGNKAGALRWNHIFNESLFAVLNISGSQYENGFVGNNSGFGFIVENTITDYTAKGSMEWFITNDATLKGGVEITNYTFSYYQNTTGSDTAIASGTQQAGLTNLKIRDWTGSAFLQGNYQLTDLIGLQAGLRIDHYDQLQQTYLDPRLAVRLQVQPGVAVKGAWGVFHQYLHLASLPDFSFFDTWLPTDSTSLPGIGNHYIAGVETEAWEGVNLNVDVYFKTMENLTELNRFNTRAGTVSQIFYTGKGHSYGAELFLQKRAGQLTGWVGYGLGFIAAQFDSINGGREFRPKYDRRHDIKVVAQYKINERWEVGASFAFQSGQSYTGATSRFRTHLPGDTVAADVVVPSERFGLRLPPSHQLNINANYTSTLFGLPMRLLIDLYNVYSRRDIWFRYYDTTTDETKVTDVRLLPIIPSVALEVKF
ncbi:MAG: TonB-dependent receptor [Chlorobi bacterium]|nr:MAG: TonB-dependent receptor plug [Chlorobi bacterium OLB7]MBK8911195.1 TonB-dependent receptor [Chlorobiota bacterium]